MVNIASDDILSNIGVACIIIGVLLGIGAFFYNELFLMAIITVVIGGVLYYIRNKDSYGEH